MEKNYQVIVRRPMGEMLEVDLCRTEEQFKNMTVRQLEEKICEKFPQFAEEERLRLIFIDKMLDGDNTLLSDYGIQHKSVIHMVMKVPGGGGPIDENSGMGDKTGKNRSMESLKLSF